MNNNNDHHNCFEIVPLVVMPRTQEVVDEEVRAECETGDESFQFNLIYPWMVWGVDRPNMKKKSKPSS